MTKSKLIKIAEIKKQLDDGKAVSFNAKVAVHSNGFFVSVKTETGDFVLATYLSKPRLFKRADALIKEAAELGLSSVVFDISDYMEKGQNSIFD